jgi:Domain of unknown function (DUF4139)/N-terminal domain of unknown function (DUF4140)
MQKLIYSLILMLAVYKTGAQEKKIPLHADIKSVVVYLRGAVVKRSGQVAIPVGRSEIVLQEVSFAIEPQSIQLSLDADLTILSVGTRKNFFKEKANEEEINILTKQLEGINEKIKLIQKKQDVYKQDELMLLRNQELKGGPSGLRVADLKAALDFQASRLEEIFKNQIVLEKTLKELDNQRLLLTAQLHEFDREKQPAIQEIYAVVDAKTALISTVDLSYLVKEAGWYPTYNISVKDISSPLDIQFNANLYQSSGELWRNVKISLSSGNPNEHNNKPVVAPWYLYYAEKNIPYKFQSSPSNGVAYLGRIIDEKNQPIIGAIVGLNGTGMGSSTDASGVFRLKGDAFGGALTISAIGYSATQVQAQKGFLTIQLQKQENSLDEVIVTGYTAGLTNENKLSERVKETAGLAGKSSGVGITTVYQPITTRYDIHEIFTVPSDGKMHMIDIKSISANALYSYYAAPKLDPAAFLTAKLINWQSFDLMPGEANLFFEGTYLGKSFVDPSLSEDTMLISLGKDEGVMVKRLMVKEYSTKRFLGSNKTESRVFEWQVRNNKQQEISIVVEDLFPISTMKEMEVDLQDAGGGVVNDATKVITWQTTVPSKSEEKHQIKYTVRYPKEKFLALD